MNPRRVLMSAGLVATLSACASAPPPAPPIAVVPFEQKLASMIRLEDQRVLRDPAPVAPPAPATPPRKGQPVIAVPPPPDLVALLGDGEARVRRRAALAIGRAGLADGVGGLAARLASDPEPEVRQMCAFALGLLGRREGVQPLQTALADASPLVRGRAAEALGLIGETASAPAIGAMVAGYVKAGALTSIDADESDYPLAPDVEAARLGLYALARLKAYDPLASAVLDTAGRPVSRWWPIAYAFRRVGDARGAVALRALVEGDGVYTRAFAARGLGVVKDVASVGVLQRLAAGAASSPTIGVEAIRALGDIGDAQAFGTLATLLRARGLPAELRVEIVRALGALKRLESTDLLLDLASDRVPAVRAEALTALAKVDPDRFVVTLSTLDRDREWTVRAALAGAIAELPVETAAPLLEPMLKDDDRRVHPAVLAALAKRKTPNAGILALGALKADDPIVRSAAASAVAELKPAGAVEALTAALALSRDDKPNDARVSILAALVAFGADAATASLDAALADPDWAVRLRARQLVAELGPSRDVSAAIRPAPSRLDSAAYASPEIVAPSVSTHVYLETDKGTVQIELAVLDAPLTVRSFTDLARSGYFDGTAIHRVVPNFVVQDGDPRGDGEGGPGYTIRDEINQLPYLRGAVGMALAGPDTGGSQFFITHSPQPHLDGRYTVFGQVINGMDVVDRLERGDVIRKVRVWDGK